MPYPRRLLSPGEEVVEEFRSHWQVIVPPMALALVAVAGIVATLLWVPAGARVIVILGLVALWLLLSVPRLLHWWFTRFVITNERVIFRAGIVAKHGKEIPLEVINDVSFHQSVWERLVGAGDLLFESAGELGQSRYTDVPRPEHLQSLIYRLREERQISLNRSPSSSVADELEGLARLRDQGVLSEDEFTAQKKKLLGP